MMFDTWVGVYHRNDRRQELLSGIHSQISQAALAYRVN